MMRTTRGMLLLLGLLTAGSAFAQEAECLRFNETSFQVPTPLAGPVTRNLAWQDHVVALQEDAVRLVGLENSMAPEVVASVSGAFRDIAVSTHTMAVVAEDRAWLYSLPQMSLLAEVEFEGGSPNVGLSDSLLAINCETDLFLWDVSIPTTPILRSAITVPYIYTDMGMGQLFFSGKFLVGCGYRLGNIMGGWKTGLTVYDITDPSSPVQTDHMQRFPFASEGSINLFLECQPIEDGLLLEGLVNSGPYNPPYQDNTQTLARLELDENGMLLWRGAVTVNAPMGNGFIVDGSTVLWTSPPRDRLVNIDWALDAPTDQNSRQVFPAGDAEFFPERSLLNVGGRFYHLESLLNSEGNGFEYNHGSDLKILDPQYGIYLDWYGASGFGDCGGWDLCVVDTTDPDLSIVSRISGLCWDLRSFALIGRSILAPHFEMGNTLREVTEDGTILDPVTTDLPYPETSLRWDDYDVVAFQDGSLGIFHSPPGEEFQRIYNNDGYGGECRLTRVGQRLYIHQALNTRALDLSDPESPVDLGLQDVTLNGFSRYFPEDNFLLVANEGLLRWFTVLESQDLMSLGSWPVPEGMEIEDMVLSQDWLYLAMGEDGMLVYNFTGSGAPVLHGGSLAKRPRALVSISSMGILPCPPHAYLPLDCQDPLPIQVADFAAETLAGGVELSWISHLPSAANHRFYLQRLSQGKRTLVGSVEQSTGLLKILDSQRPGPGLTRFQLFLNDPEGVGTCLAEVALEIAPPGPRPVFERVFPNPANPGTEVHFSVPTSGVVRLSVYSADGRRVRDLVDGYLEAGAHTRFWDGRNVSGRAVAAGVYFLRLETEEGLARGRVTLIK